MTNDWMKNLWYFDMEVLPHDWLFCAQSTNGEYASFHNNNDALSIWLYKNKPLLCGFNSKHYDSFIIKSILVNNTPEQTKSINDAIIVDGILGWNIDMGYVNMPDFMDLMLDLPTRPSLKLIEGNLKMDIRESTIDFNTEFPTKEEWLEMVEYCWHDVEALIPLFNDRLSYLEAKVTVAEMAGIDSIRALNMTNAQLTAKFLDATKTKRDDEREYEYPINIDRKFIPQKVFDFFDMLPKNEIPLDVLFGKEGIADSNGKVVKSRNPYKNLAIEIGGCPSVVAWGGLHGALKHYSEETTKKRIIMNTDVTSYYPSLMIVNHLISRNVPDPEVFKNVFNRRVEAKKTGDIKVNEALKLILNTTYGASNNQYNSLYDPLMAHSVCIDGQLYLIQLAERLYREVPTIKFIQLNTDGIMFSVDTLYKSEVRTILDDWQASTGFGLEDDYIKKVVQRDVNNYVMQKTNGKVKVKGGTLSDWTGGTFKHNSLSITCKAIVERLLHDTPVVDTINNCQNPFAFQMITKAGGTFDCVMHEVNGKLIKVNKTNRIYASEDKSLGILYKMKGENRNKTPNCPDNAIVDNSAQISIDAIDKAWYIELTNERVEKFLGIRRKKMPKKKKEVIEEVTDEEVIILDDEETTEDTENATGLDSIKVEKDVPVKDTTIKTVKRRRKTKDTVEKVSVEIPSFKEKMYNLGLDMAIASKAFIKDGYNDNQNYEYVKASQYKSMLRDALAKNRLIHKIDDIMCNLPTDAIKSTKMTLTQYHAQLTITDVDSDEKCTYMLWAQGADNLDKGLSKAKTLGLKDFIKSNFLISDGEDDPEEDVVPTGKLTGKKLPKPKFVTPDKKKEVKKEIIAEKNLCSEEKKAIIIENINKLRVAMNSKTWGTKKLKELEEPFSDVDADMLLTKLELKGDDYGLEL